MWLLSPFLYIGFVKCAKYVKIPFQNQLRKINNIALSLFSSGLCFLCAVEIYKQTDDFSLHSFTCKIYQETNTLYFIMYSFYLSKYWEWLDTYFIVHSNKQLTNLHYYHHMSTPVLSYINTLYNGVSPSYIYACFLNTFVHSFMYSYYAFPNSKLRKYKKLITKVQILQHVCIFSLSIYIFRNCYIKEKYLALWLNLILYLYYLVMFILFYLTSYIKMSIL